MVRVRARAVVFASLMLIGCYGCGGAGRCGADNSAQPAPGGFAEAMVRAIRSPDGKNVRSVMAPEDYILGTRMLMDLRSPEERCRQYEKGIRGQIVKVQEDLTAKGFRWQTCVLASASILLANTEDHPTTPAVQQLHSRVVLGEKVETPELLPALVPLVEGQKQHGIVFLFLEDGAQEAVVRVNTMPTKEGRRIALLGPRIEVQSVGPISRGAKGS